MGGEGKGKDREGNGGEGKRIEEGKERKGEEDLVYSRRLGPRKT